MDVKLFDSELKIMEILWQEGDTTAKKIAEIAAGQTGWSKTTTYTVIKKCIDKGVIQRQEPGFKCHALISQKQAQQYETDELINKMYNGSADRLIANILDNRRLTSDELRHLRELLDSME